MKNMLLAIILLAVYTATAQRPLIHSHNDYEKPEPLINALRYKVFSVEADVYAGDSLFVAHNKKDIRAGRTLVSMYLQPIVQLFETYHHRISADADYAPTLLIDIKENSALVIPALVKLLSPYRNVFDHSINPHAVQVVVSGERGPVAQWIQCPAYILFDGRPYETYDSATLERVAMISDSYMNYAQKKDSSMARIQDLSIKAHTLGKPLLLWAIPDKENSWGWLLESGVDILNTDNVAACYKYFYGNATGK